MCVEGRLQGILIIKTWMLLLTCNLVTWEGRIVILVDQPFILGLSINT